MAECCAILLGGVVDHDLIWRGAVQYLNKQVARAYIEVEIVLTTRSIVRIFVLYFVFIEAAADGTVFCKMKISSHFVSFDVRLVMPQK